MEWVVVPALEQRDERGERKGGWRFWRRSAGSRLRALGEGRVGWHCGLRDVLGGEERGDTPVVPR
eukprot:4312377-Pleurochrysis_carterae.AAC.1